MPYPYFSDSDPYKIHASIDNLFLLFVIRTTLWSNILNCSSVGAIDTPQASLLTSLLNLTLIGL